MTASKALGTLSMVIIFSPNNVVIRTSAVPKEVSVTVTTILATVPTTHMVIEVAATPLEQTSVLLC